MYQVRKNSTDLAAHLKDVLHSAELEWLLSQPHKALAVTEVLTTIIQKADVEGLVKHRMDQQVAALVLYMGACGRIYNTAIPAAYSRCAQTRGIQAWLLQNLVCCL